MAQLDVFAFASIRTAELHVRLQGFVDPSSIIVEVDGVAGEPMTKDLTNKVYVVKLSDLEPDTEYNISVIVTYDGSNEETASTSFVTNADYERPKNDNSEFKDFYIGVYEPGAYSENMKLTDYFGVKERFKTILVKHAPYSPMAKIKNVVVQSWKDEDGDDVWLPRATGSTIGNYIPAVVHEAVDYEVTFVIFSNKSKADSNAKIRELVNTIEGRWLKIWDEYTHMGFTGAYLLDIDDDPTFKRRNYDHIEFTLKFKVNGTNLEALEDIK